MTKLFKLASIRLLGLGSAKAATNGDLGIEVEEGGRPFPA